MRGTWNRGTWRGVSTGLSLGLSLWVGCAAAQGSKPMPPAQPAAQEESTRNAPAAHHPTPSEVERDLRAMELISRGATLDEIAGMLGPRVQTPEEAIHELKAGNARFFSGEARRPELSANQRRAQIYTQTPFAAILGCADSRVPTEIVYDQGLGNIFTTRVAGNVVTPATAGSLEYAVLHLKPRVVLVMGHEGCGAVHAALKAPTANKNEPENVRMLLEAIRPAVAQMPPMVDEKARMREAVIRNVRLQVQELKKNPVIAAAVARKEIAVIGTFYEITSGAVDFLQEDKPRTP
jgi:carbonic anhydrase